MKEKESKENVLEEVDVKEDDSLEEKVEECATKPKGLVNKEKKSNKAVIFVILLMVIVLVGGCLFLLLNDKTSETEKTKTEQKEYKSEYRISGNSLEKFDLYFLQLENGAKNKVYSPLSIKYALEMLGEGSSGDSKAQIDSVIGDYKANKYTNSQHMSFANAMFIRNSYKDAINSEYIQTLSNKYNAEIVYDSFDNASNMNAWVNNKTLGLINNLFDDETVQDQNYILTNALAIDMEWNKLIQATTERFKDRYSVSYAHENFSAWVMVIDDDCYGSVSFNNGTINAKSVEVGAALNNYDIVTVLGEENIRKTVGEEYKKWLTTKEASYYEPEQDVDKYLDTYIAELNSNYKRVDSSTDFSLYVDDDVKVFAKDLKEYDGTTLQYVGIMPKKVSLENYVKDIDATKVNNLIGNLKEIKSENFKDGVVTKITGKIPLFKFDYELDLVKDLQKLGITDVFDINKANLSLISSKEKSYISDASHKATIEFSNEGIKAAAATQAGGAGAIGGGFEYLYDVPVEEIDVTFDNPYMFLIRDKKTGEVWFVGTVYEPIVNDR